MPLYSERTHEARALLDVIHPDLHQGRYYTPWVDMADYHCFLAELYVGDIAQGGTVDMEMQQAQDAAGTGAKAVVSAAGITKAITQLTQAGGDGNDSCCVDCRTEELDVDGGFHFVRLRMDVLVAAANACLVFSGWNPRVKPVVNNWTEVVAG